MKSKSVVILTVFVLATFALAGCGGRRAEETTHAAESAPSTGTPQAARDEVLIPAGSPKLSQIRVEVVKEEMTPVGKVTAPGKIEVNPNRVSRVMLPLAGRVVTVSAKIGDLVQRGQPLFTVEGPDIDATVSAIQQAEAALLQAQAAETKAQADIDRVRDLFEHNAVAQKEVVNAESVLAQAKAAVHQAQAAVQQARRRAEVFGIEPEQFGQHITVRAPISGKILEISVVPGEYRNDTSVSLMTIADLSSVWVSADVPETSIRLIDVGERIEIELSAYPGETFSGRVTQIADTVDPQSRTIAVRAELDNPRGRLRPEMFGQIRHIDRYELRPVVPVSAILQEEGQNLVWVEAAPGRFVRTPVQTGERAGDRQAITSGVRAGDKVVVDGVMLLKAN
jgi:cobalt-zinc-cadmium efflux system membrane fusion protein